MRGPGLLRAVITLPESVVTRYRAFSLYNSPYRAHETGRAIDLYPDRDRAVPSPVAGRVVDVRTVRAPPRPYAAATDHLIAVETDAHVARILHVDPTVEVGETIAVGDPIGDTVRSGYFEPWVDDHLHLGFRPPGADVLRATGSVRVTVAADPEPVPWDGSGRVVERGRTYAVLDAPGHPAPGARFAGVAVGPRALDGGLPHYPGGGVFPGVDGEAGVRLLGERVGVAAGRTVAWDDVAIRVNDAPVTGLSLALNRDRLGVKLVSRDGLPIDVGGRVEVTVG